MKTQEELQRELLNQTTEVENALVKLEKANLILGRWMNEYVFVDKPDPREAVKRGESKSGEKNIKADDSFKWFYDYNQIIGLLDIAFDYVHESKELLKNVVYGEKENKGAA